MMDNRHQTVSGYLRETGADLPLAGHTTMPIPKYVKLLLACLLCLAVITGLVLLIQRLF